MCLKFPPGQSDADADVDADVDAALGLMAQDLTKITDIHNKEP